MKVAVLTALFGSKSELRSLTEKELDYRDNGGVSFYAFLDRPHESATGWNQILGPEYSFDKIYGHRRNHKIYKMLPHLFAPDHDIYIWVDSCHSVQVDPHKLCKEYLRDNDIALFDHPYRNCAYQESFVCAQSQIDQTDYIQDTISFLRSETYPENNGLYEMSAFIRRNNEATQELGYRWFELTCRFSSRDQITFPYCLFKLKDKINISILPGYIHHSDGNEFFLKLEEPELIKKY